MDKLKSLLLPLAFVFASIAVFEFGARYGAANMRAVAIASELQLPLSIYLQGKATMDKASRDSFAMLIDNGIAAGAMQRELWYLNKESKSTLEKAMTSALSVRGDGVFERFKSAQTSETSPDAYNPKITAILDALKKAKVDLIDNAPKTEAKESTE